jgi:hyperosmotically inducible periplasmic protein
MMRKLMQSIPVYVFLMVSLMAVTQPQAALAESSVSRPSQERVANAVRHELLMIPQLGIFDDLSYKVDGGTVTLTGEVRNPIIKDEAQGAVRQIAGVDRVENKIEILPYSFNDDRIRRQVALAVFRDPWMHEYAVQPVPPIHIIVKNGRVDLEGVVDSQAAKNVAGIRANETPGVFSVDNNLRVAKS